MFSFLIIAPFGRIPMDVVCLRCSFFLFVLLICCFVNLLFCLFVVVMWFRVYVSVCVWGRERERVRV